MSLHGRDVPITLHLATMSFSKDRWRMKVEQQQVSIKHHKGENEREALVINKCCRTDTDRYY